MTPLEKYQHDLRQADFFADPAQANAVSLLDDLYHRMLAPKPEIKASFLQRFFKSHHTQADIVPIKGLYFWGGVGRGKTYLVDTFFDCLPFERKSRMHFHRFMHRVHQELKQLDGVEDPLMHVADTLKQETDILCFDEFFVSDITDAMILGTLLDALFQRGITFVATSNIPPSELYRNGLQRTRFLPAIALIEQHCDIVNVDAGIDYRLRTLTQAEIYHSPLDNIAAEQLTHYFEQLTTTPCYTDKNIEINGRELVAQREADGVIQFHFKTLCQTARSQTDYMEIARIYHTVILSNVPQITEQEDDAARRFIAMVDEFYERNVTLIISAAVPMEQLYQQGRLTFEFRRCCSRLTEMQSHAYLAKPHLA